MSAFISLLDKITVVRKSASAVLVLLDDEEYWIPFSQLSPDTLTAVSNGETEFEEFGLTEWIATEKGMI